MHIVLCSFSYIFVFLVAVEGFELSELGFKKCHLEDEECLLTSFRLALPRFVQGIPEYGVEVMDEMVIDNVKFEITGLKLTLKDARLKGDKDIILDKTKFDTSKKTITVDYHVPLYILTGRYNTDGKILTLPVQGEGDIEIRLQNVVVRSKVNYDLLKKDDKTYIAVKQNSYEFTIGDAHYNLTNLFRGNKELSETTLKFINDNSKDVTLEFGKPVLDVVSKKTFRNVKKFLAKAPLEDITIID
ncbi:unnamed protein product, partial [Brenthis ino]